jgi:ATP-dependent Lon protease
MSNSGKKRPAQDEDPDQQLTIPKEVPVLPVRDMVLFPQGVLPLTIGRESSVQLVNLLGEEKILAVVAQKDGRTDSPESGELHSVGTLARVHKIVRLPNQNLFVFVEGLQRIRVKQYTQTKPFLKAQVEVLEDVAAPQTPELEALQRSVLETFQQIVASSPNLSDELQVMALNIDEAGRLADFVAASLPVLSTAQRQEILETLQVDRRLEILNRHLIKEQQLLALRSKIQSGVQEQVTQGQRQFFLREQLKAIQKELGEGDEGQREVEELRKAIAESKMPEEVEKEALKEPTRFSRMSPAAAEYTISRTYLDWLTTLPWSRSTQVAIDIPKARDILEADHYNLVKVKERILEHLAVLQRKPAMKGPILCFVGPPGVGKTSLGKSIACALGLIQESKPEFATIP